MPGGFFIHSGRLLGMARAAAERARVEVSADANSRPQDAITAVVMAAVSAEAFINELGELALASREGPWFAAAEANKRLFEFGDVLEEIEAARGSLMLKYQMASKILAGTTLNKGKNPTQDFAILISLRNDFVHLKPRDNIDRGPDGRLVVHPPRYVADLQRRGFAHKPLDVDVMSWFDLLMTVELADWACATARNMILEVLSFIPDDPSPLHDPASLMKTIFRREHASSGMSPNKSFERTREG